MKRHKALTKSTKSKKRTTSSEEVFVVGSPTILEEIPADEKKSLFINIAKMMSSR